MLKQGKMENGHRTTAMMWFLFNVTVDMDLIKKPIRFSGILILKRSTRQSILLTLSLIHFLTWRTLQNKLNMNIQIQCRLNDFVNHQVGYKFLCLLSQILKTVVKKQKIIQIIHLYKIQLRKRKLYLLLLVFILDNLTLLI